MESALILTPFLALMLGVMELSLPLFKKSLFTAAVREGCRYGITYQNLVPRDNLWHAEPSHSSCSPKQRDGIPERDYRSKSNQGAVFFARVPTEVTGTPTANGDGNVLQVSVQGYRHAWIAPVLWFWGPINFSVTNGSLTIAAISADRLESLPGGSSRPAP